MKCPARAFHVGELIRIDFIRSVQDASHEVGPHSLQFTNRAPGRFRLGLPGLHHENDRVGVTRIGQTVADRVQGGRVDDHAVEGIVCFAQHPGENFPAHRFPGVGGITPTGKKVEVLDDRILAEVLPGQGSLRCFSHLRVDEKGCHAGTAEIRINRQRPVPHVGLEHGKVRGAEALPFSGRGTRDQDASGRMRRKRSTQGSDTFTDQRIRVAGDEEGIRQAHFPVKDLGNFGENGQPQGRFDLLARVERPVQQSETDYESEPTHHSKHSGCSNRDLLLRRDRLRRDEGLSELPDHRFIDALVTSTSFARSRRRW